MKCDCRCDMYDFDPPEFYSESYPVAKKAYKCCECGESILPGQKYHKAVGKWCGDFDVYRTCAVCDKIRRDFCPSGFVFGELCATIEDCLGFDYTEVPDEEDEL